jgi:hypothetical protein
MCYMDWVPIFEAVNTPIFEKLYWSVLHACKVRSLSTSQRGYGLPTWVSAMGYGFKHTDMFCFFQTGVTGHLSATTQSQSLHHHYQSLTPCSPITMAIPSPAVPTNNWVLTLPFFACAPTSHDRAQKREGPLMARYESCWDQCIGMNLTNMNPQLQALIDCALDNSSTKSQAVALNHSLHTCLRLVCSQTDTPGVLPLWCPDTYCLAFVHQQ